MPSNDQPPPPPRRAPPGKSPLWTPTPSGPTPTGPVPPPPRPQDVREVLRARERAERAARRADRAAEKAREVEVRAARRSSSGDIVQAAGDAANAALTAVSAVADEATERWTSKQRLNALDQALTTARAGGRVDIAPPTRKEALALADRTAPSSIAASLVRGSGIVGAGIVALAMLSIGGFGWLGLIIPVALIVMGGSLGDRIQGAHKSRVADRIQLELARAALPAEPVTVKPAQQARIGAGATPGGAVEPMVTGRDRTPRLVEDGDLRTSPEIVAALDRLAARVERLLTPADVAALRRIRDAAALALPPGDGPLDLTDHETWLARQICTDYLPRAIEHYLALPRDLALEPVLDGRSARQVLDEQLTLIEKRLRAMAERAFRREAGGLMNHARFVADSLRPDPLQERLAELATADAEAARIAEASSKADAAGTETARERDPA